MVTATPDTAEQRSSARSALWVGIPIGIGVVGALDEIVFHQLLQWHHFYVHASPHGRIFSDGLFHIFTTALLVLGTANFWRQRRRLSQLRSGRPLWAGIFLGAGAFQLFDGTVNHKVLQIHPVREGVPNILAYDLVWNVAAVLLLLLGWWLSRGVPVTGGSTTAAQSRSGR